MWQDYQDEWVQMVCIGVGHNVAEAKAWKSEYNLTYPVLADPGGTVWNRFGMGYIPHNTIIDDEMFCRFTNYGFNENQLRNIIEQYSEPLVKIVHDYLPNTENTTQAYTVEADIFSGGSLIPGSLVTYYNTDGSASFMELPMTNAGGDMYRANIPAQPSGTTVYYYIGAAADNGKSSVLPLTAPAEPAMFDVLVDTMPPQIAHTPLVTWLEEYWPASVMAEVTDTLGVGTVTLEFNVNGGSNQTVALSNTSGDMWEGDFTGSIGQGDVVNYRIHAVDTAAAQNAGVIPETGWYSMDISAMVDALVLDFDGNTNSGPVIRDGLQGMGLEVHYLTEMPALPELYETIWVCLGVAPDNHTLDAADDTALYNYLQSGRNLYLEGGNFWKDDPRVDLYFEFGVGTTGSGANDAGTQNGEPGGLAAGMSFGYSGDNNNIDRLKTKSGGQAILRNANPDYLTMINKDSGSFKTIASSIEFGGLTGQTTALLTAYAEFLGLEPGSSPTPTPTPDPGGCDTLGVKISMPSNDIGAGDMVNTIVTVCNPGQTTYENVPLWVILDVWGDYFFYPSFNDFDYETINLPPGEWDFIVLPDFMWPQGIAAADGIIWYAGMTNQEMTDLMGDFDMFTFGWH